MAKGFKCGDSGGLSMELLWENASPTSTFAGQNIYLSMPDGVEFFFIETGEGGTGTFVRLGCSAYISVSFVYNNTSYILARHANVSSDGFGFATGYIHNLKDGTTAQGDGRLIPRKIYAVRGVS